LALEESFETIDRDPDNGLVAIVQPVEDLPEQKERKKKKKTRKERRRASRSSSDSEDEHTKQAIGAKKRSKVHKQSEVIKQKSPVAEVRIAEDSAVNRDLSPRPRSHETEAKDKKTRSASESSECSLEEEERHPSKMVPEPQTVTITTGSPSSKSGTTQTDGKEVTPIVRARGPMKFSIDSYESRDAKEISYQKKLSMALKSSEQNSSLVESTPTPSPPTSPPSVESKVIAQKKEETPAEEVVKEEESAKRVVDLPETPRRTPSPAPVQEDIKKEKKPRNEEFILEPVEPAFAVERVSLTLALSYLT
jgi:hypothetical protein